MTPVDPPSHTSAPSVPPPDGPDWVLQLHTSPDAVDAERWDALLAMQDAPTPFMRHAYLAAMQASGSAVADTGWQAVWFTLHEAAADGQARPDWVAACVAYVKSHSYGEYVFDWAWADAYARHGLSYYPKAVLAVPFTPVPGTRLLAPSDETRRALLAGVLQWCEAAELSSLHLLFGSEADLACAERLHLMRRETVQFHWAPAVHTGTGASEAGETGEPARPDFEAFLQTLQRDKRKKIQQERRRVRDAGVRFRVLQGHEITAADWDFFYRCYEQTYWEHGNAPYLTRAFFEAMARDMPEAWLLFVAERVAVPGDGPDGAPVAARATVEASAAAGAAQALTPQPGSAIGPGQPAASGHEHAAAEAGVPQPIACSLIGLTHDAGGRVVAAHGRYWGALERVDCLHFEACYYQPIAWCLAHGVSRFEGGAQGEHKMARALMPVATHSAHWLARPDFADAVARFLAREGEGVHAYLDHLAERSPFKGDVASVNGVSNSSR
nr:GNAT family N-acetyltransferase [Comamonas serinivorans]